MTASSIPVWRLVAEAMAQAIGAAVALGALGALLMVAG
jgi:hypothetical protein